MASNANGINVVIGYITVIMRTHLAILLHCQSILPISTLFPKEVFFIHCILKQGHANSPFSVLCMMKLRPIRKRRIGQLEQHMIKQQVAIAVSIRLLDITFFGFNYEVKVDLCFI